MTIGEKIKKARKEKKLTQHAVVKDKITRNMLSQIESGVANPSLETIKFIAEQLSLPADYLISEDNDLFFYEKKDALSEIYKLYSAKKYKLCIDKILSLTDLDDELAYLVASASFYLSKECVLRGSFQSALKYIEQVEIYSQKTKIPTEHFHAPIKMYSAIVSNVQAPLLEFDESEYVHGLNDFSDFEVYRYLMQDFSYNYKDLCISNHIKAKALIKDRKFNEAITVLLDTIEKGLINYNAFIMFGIYADLEYCYKQLYDFEKAYLYSSKRLSMLEGFKS